MRGVFNLVARVLHKQILVFVGFMVLFSASSVAAIAAVSQGYLTKDPIAVGSLVSVTQDTTDSVEAATIRTAGNLIGVTINTGSTPLSLSNKDANEVQVATNGTVPVLVSDINGEIVQGDHITASTINGVGMKATSNAKVVGVAQGGVTGASTQAIKTSSGDSQDVTIGTVPVLVSVSYHYEQPEKTIIPATIQNMANAIAGKKVDPMPILLSAGIFIFTIIIVTVIIYSMIRNSIISVGRNPLAQSAVYRGVVQLSVLVLAILAAGLVSIYFILRML